MVGSCPHYTVWKTEEFRNLLYAMQLARGRVRIVIMAVSPQNPYS